MKILQLSALWEDVPPKTYGGTELVVYNLCEGLIRQGHEVLLIAPKESKTSAKIVSPVKKPLREMGTNIPFFYEDMAISMAIEESAKYDIVHNHLGLPVLPFHNLFKCPMVTTLHGAFVVKEETKAFQFYKNLPYISISNSQRKGNPSLNYVSTVYNGIDVNKFEFRSEPDTNNPYLAYLGRISPEKGAHHAIRLARETGWKLIIAAKVDGKDVDYYEKEIKPCIDNKQIVFIGEVDHVGKENLLKNAHALIHAVTWPEPFGLTMVESMACGTPVLALNMGSIPEVINHGVTGYIEETIEGLINRVKDIDKIDRYACRKHVVENFSDIRMVENYLQTYQKVIETGKHPSLTVKSERTKAKKNTKSPLH